MKALFLTIAFIGVICSQGVAGVDLVTGGESDYRVILSRDASPSEKRAAAELKRYIKEISGAVLTDAPDGAIIPAKAVLIGDSQALRSLRTGIDFGALGDEGYVITIQGDRLIIAGGRRRGTMYGVYAFLEDVLGCRWYSSKVTKCPKMSNIALDSLDITGKPAFEYRDVFYTDAFDKDWAARNRTNGASARLDSETGGKVAYYPFVHSFAALVPLDKYWDSHPEYFSMIDGKRTREQTQLCMSNPEVVKVATETVLGWMRDHPEARIYSVSHNDWYRNCQCDKCKAIDEEEGSPSGLLLRFVNAIAEQTEKVYPDKLVDTLAYQWTEKPPKITKPRDNVRVRLCPIFCCEAHPYEKCDAPENKAFIENLKNWSKLTDNLYIWHYNTSFAHYLNPFPDFRQLADSAKLYRRTGVKGIFWEGNYSGGGGGEFAEMRAYLLAKITWDPDVDADAVLKDFVSGYYGAAGRHIWSYAKLLMDKVTDENIHFRIWAGPQDAYLTPDLLSKAEDLLGKAEGAAESPQILDRVRHARLPIDYVRLMKPILAKEYGGKRDELVAQLDGFVAKCKHYGITNISEGETLDAFHARVKKQLQEP